MSIDVVAKPEPAAPTAAVDQAPTTLPRREGRIAVVDGLRLLAALMVVAFHYTYRAPGQWGAPTPRVFPLVYHVTAYGRFGVELFFLISGFVICMSAWGRSLGAFAISRVTRLYPAYWFGVLATTAVLVMFGHGGTWEGHQSFGFLAVNLTMLQAPLNVPAVDGVYWTLWAELHFYLLFALVVWRGLTYRRVVTFCVLWTIGALLVPRSQLPVLELLIDSSHAPFFIAGVAMYLMYRFRPTILLWGIVGVSYVLALYQAIPTVADIAALGRPVPHPVSQHVGWAVVTAIFALMSAVALGWLNWIRGAWLTVAGALTYPLYLLHEDIGWLVIARLHSRVPKWPLVIGLVAVMLVVAWLVHRLVERPFAPRLKRALTVALAKTSQAEPEPRLS